MMSVEVVLARKQEGLPRLMDVSFTWATFRVPPKRRFLIQQENLTSGVSEEGKCPS